MWILATYQEFLTRNHLTSYRSLVNRLKDLYLLKYSLSFIHYGKLKKSMKKGVKLITEFNLHLLILCMPLSLGNSLISLLSKCRIIFREDAENYRDRPRKNKIKKKTVLSFKIFMKIIKMIILVKIRMGKNKYSRMVWPKKRCTRLLKKRSKGSKILFNSICKEILKILFWMFRNIWLSINQLITKSSTKRHRKKATRGFLGKLKCSTILFTRMVPSIARLNTLDTWTASSPNPRCDLAHLALSESDLV